MKCLLISGQMFLPGFYRTPCLISWLIRFENLIYKICPLIKWMFAFILNQIVAVPK